MSMMTNINDTAESADLPEGTPPPASKRRVLLYAITPILLLALLTAGIRFVSEAAQKREADTDAAQFQQLRAMRPGPAKGGTLPKPPHVYTADTATQAALEAVVRGQLDAIHHRDFEKALSFAIPTMRNGQSASQFGAMIQQAYAPMLDAKAISLSSAQIQKGSERQQASIETNIETTSGGHITYAYMLRSEGNNWWVIGVAPRSNAMFSEDATAPVPHSAPPSQRDR